MECGMLAMKSKIKTFQDLDAWQQVYCRRISSFQLCGKDRFYSIAFISLTELQNQIILSHEVHYFGDEIYKTIYDKSIHVQKILGGLIKASKSFQ
jgi:hypothetical protein